MVIQHNLAAMNATRQFNMVDKRKQKLTEKLSSGYRINRAADDAAGLAISEKMRRQIRGLTQGVKNLQDGVSLCQVADGALEEVTSMLHRIEELAVKAANGTSTESDRAFMQSEVAALRNEIDRISESTTFNNKRVFSYGNTEPKPPIRTVTNFWKQGVGVKSMSVSADATGLTVDAIGLDDTVYNYNATWDQLRRVSADGINGTYIWPTAGDGSMPVKGGFTATNFSDLSEMAGAVNSVSFSGKKNETDANGNPYYGDFGIGLAYTSDVFDPSIYDEENITWIQAGSENGQGMELSIHRMNSTILGIEYTDVSSQFGAGNAMDEVKVALQRVSENRSSIGATQNRLEHAIRNEENIVENTTDAESRIRDLDMADAMVEMAMANILSQAGITMMSQANKQNELVLQLIS